VKLGYIVGYLAGLGTAAGLDHIARSTLARAELEADRLEAEHVAESQAEAEDTVRYGRRRGLPRYDGDPREGVSLPEPEWIPRRGDRRPSYGPDVTEAGWLHPSCGVRFATTAEYIAHDC
jgi:hypothetical protein